MKEEEIITRLKAIDMCDMWYDVGEQYSLNDLNAIEGILKLYEKQNNKIQKAIDFINDENNFFEDGENWQNVLKIKEILEEN